VSTVRIQVEVGMASLWLVRLGAESLEDRVQGQGLTTTRIVLQNLTFSVQLRPLSNAAREPKREIKVLRFGDDGDAV
jgi:hypothetical protein